MSFLIFIREPFAMWTEEEKEQSFQSIRGLFSLISSLEPPSTTHHQTSIFPFYVQPEKREVRVDVEFRDFYEDCYCVRAKEEYEDGYFVERDPWYATFHVARVSPKEDTDISALPSLISIGGMGQMWVTENHDIAPYAGNIFSPSSSYSDFQRLESFVMGLVQTILDSPPAE